MPARLTAREGVCPACGAAGAPSAMTVAGHSFRRCRSCLTLFIGEAPARLHEQYQGRRYFVDDGFGSAGEGSFHGYRDYLADRREITAKFERVLGHVERLVAPGRLLDVGAGPGLMVAAATARGWQAEGLDLNAWAASYAREELGQDVRQGTLEEARFEDASFDAVSMLDLIEHVPEPRSLLEEAARVLRPGGALALLTPDAGSPVSRLMGRRWPEIQRPPEHVVLFSVRGLAQLLEETGFRVEGWHSIGKETALETLLEDVAPAAPALAGAIRPLLRDRSLGRARVEVDPRTKFCLYAVRAEAPGPGPVREAEQAAARPPRLPRRPVPARSTEEAILDELRTLARARRLCDWMFEQFADSARGRAAEVGAGIGTFSDRLLDAGVRELLLIEPEPGCAGVLEPRYAPDPRVELSRDALPDSPALAGRAGQLDLVLCQNVLEHIDDDHAAVRAMAAALRPGGELALLVPAHPRLFGPLDAAYGHRRRYTPELLRRVLAGAGLEVERLYHFNALGIPGWWVKNRTGATGIGPLALSAYEALVAGWRRLERRRAPPVGLSLVARARRPGR